MKTKISHLLALLTIAAAAVLIENAFLQSMTINNRAYDLIAKTTVNQLSPQNFNLMKAAGDVALADASIPLFPGAKKLTFGDADEVRYRFDASAGKVANFYNQIMASLGWQKVDGSSQSLASVGKNLDKVIIAFAENPITKKTEAIFSTKSLSQSDIFSVASASAEEAAPQPSVEPLQPIAPVDTQNNQTPPPPPAGDNNQPPLPPQQQPIQPIGQQPNGENNNPQPTCNINGVETPGACQQFNNNNGGQNFNTMEFMRPQGEGNNNQQGPSGKGMESSRPTGEQGQWQGPSEEDNKKMDERRLKDMKRGMSQFTRSAQMMKKNVARTKAAVAKCGVNIPEELSNALGSIDSLTEKINNAKSADELEEVIGDIEEVGSVMQEWGPRMGELPRLCQMLKQADRDLKQLDRSLARYQKKNSAKLDISEILAEYKTNVDSMRQALSQAKELAKTDPEEALTKIEDEFYGSMDNVRNSEQAINMVLNIGQGIRQAGAEIKKIEREIKNLKKKKIDTAELEELAADFKTQLEEIKSLVKGKFDADELISKVETTFDTLEQIYDALQEYGLGTMEPKIKENKSLNMQVNLPDAFKKQGGNEERDKQGQGDDQNGPGMNNQQPQNMMPKF